MSTSGTYPKGRARREEILAAAFDVLAKEGYRKTSLREVGKAIGVQPANILYYFPSREALLQEVVARWDARNLSEATVPGPGDGLDQWIAAVRWNMEHYGLVFLYTTFAAEAAEATHPAHQFFRMRFDRLRGSIAQSLRERQRSGRIPERIDPDRTAIRLMAMSDGLQLQWLADPSLDMAAELASAIKDLTPQVR